MTNKLYDVPPSANADPQIGLLMSMLDDGTQEWRQEMGDVADDIMGWQPFPNGHSIGALILHIASVEAFWLHEVAGQTQPADLKHLLSDETDQYAVDWPTPPSQPLAWFFEQHDAVRQRTRDIIGTFSDPAAIVKYKEYEFTLRWVLHHTITHEAYHGGQAVLLALQHQKQSD